jgi:hypothetical protein
VGRDGAALLLGWKRGVSGRAVVRVRRTRKMEMVGMYIFASLWGMKKWGIGGFEGLVGVPMDAWKEGCVYIHSEGLYVSIVEGGQIPEREGSLFIPVTDSNAMWSARLSSIST